jgi:hypothetical protein
MGWVGFCGRGLGIAGKNFEGGSGNSTLGSIKLVGNLSEELSREYFVFAERGVPIDPISDASVFTVSLSEDGCHGSGEIRFGDQVAPCPILLPVSRSA